MDTSYPKVILHLDADSFFSSVESAKNPALRGRPIITGQERGVATSMSYEAKALGIDRAMPIYKIKRDFPQVVIVSSDYEAYAMYSKRMFAIVRRYTDIVEEYSIDECFADLTGYDKIHGITYEEILKRIQDDIQKELNISVSIGCGATKVIAKIGSKWNKPHGITVITPEKTAEFLSHVPIDDIWGIGPSSASMLLRRGIKTASDFASLSQERISSFAHKPMKDLWSELNCHQVYLVNTDAHDEDQKSLSRTLSFYPYKTDRSELFAELSRNVENACIKARNSGIAPYIVTWFLKTKEHRYETYRIKLEHPTNIPSVIIGKIKEQFDRISIKGKLYKTTGVTFSHLVREDSIQQNLFDSYKEIDTKSDIFKIVDTLNQKYGRHTVHMASSMRGIERQATTYVGRNQMNFFNKIKKTGKELSIPYLGETI
jgi:DNA polymerase-4